MIKHVASVWMAKWDNDAWDFHSSIITGAEDDYSELGIATPYRSEWFIVVFVAEPESSFYVIDCTPVISVK